MCGRAKQSCLSCRATSTSARVLVREPSLPEEEEEEPPRDVPEPPPVPLPKREIGENQAAALLARYDAMLPSVRGVNDRRRQTGKLKKVLSVEEARSRIEELWSSAMRLRDAVHGGRVTATQQLDLIRLFARIPRAALLEPTRPPSMSEEVETRTSSLARVKGVRHLAGEKMAQLLASYPVAQGDSHRKSIAALRIDSLGLLDSLPDIPPPTSTPSPEDAFASDLRTIFRPSPSELRPEKQRTLLQSQRTTLVVLLEAWKRSASGPEQALKLVLGWNLEHVFKPAQHEHEGIAEFSRRQYGELLGQLPPSPLAWLEGPASDLFELKSVAPHLISFLATTGSPLEALRIWEHLESHGITLPVTAELQVTTTLLDGLAQGGLYGDTDRIVKQLEALLESSSALENEHEGEQALAVAAFRMVAKVAAAKGRPTQVATILGKLRKIGWEGGLEDPARRMRAQAQLSQLVGVRSLFDATDGLKSSKQDRVRMWGELVRAYVRVDDVESGMKALADLIDAGLRPTIAAVNSLLFGLAARHDVNRTYALFNRLGDLELRPDVVSYGALVTLHSNLRDTEAAARVMTEMQRVGIAPDQRVWTTLMNAYVELAQWTRALEIFAWLDSHPDPRMQPDSATTNVILKAIVLSATPAQNALSLFRKAVEQGLRPSPQTYTLLMQSFCSAGLMELAEELFTLMDRPLEAGPLPIATTSVVKPDAFIFSTLINGYLKRHESRKAQACLAEMRARGIRASSVTYGIIVGSFVRQRTVRGLDAAMGIAKSFLVGSPLSDRRHKHPSSDDRPFVARQALLSVLGPLIHGLSKKMEAKAAVALFSDLLEQKIEPSVAIYTSMMTAYRGAGEVDDVRFIFRRLRKRVLDAFPATSPPSYSPSPSPSSPSPSLPFSPTLETTSSSPPSPSLASPPSTPLPRQIDTSHRNTLSLPFTILINTLSEVQGGHIEIIRTWELLASEGFSFDAGNWNALGIACCLAGELETAFWVAEHVLLRGENEEIPEASTFSRFFGEGMRPDPPVRAPSRLYQLRKPERDLHRKRPEGIEELLASPVVTEAELAPTVEESTRIQRANYWFPHAAFLEVLDQALAARPALREPRVLENREKRETRWMVREAHPRTMLALAEWSRRVLRREALERRRVAGGYR